MNEEDILSFNESLRERSRSMRKNPTEAERRLWNCLRYRQLDHKFRRQQRIASYICDFVNFEKRLIIEVDGGHHNEESKYRRDSQRTAWLAKQGFTVLRFWNNEVMKNMDGVIAVIKETLARLPMRTFSDERTSPLVGEVGRRPGGGETEMNASASPKPTLDTGLSEAPTPPSPTRGEEKRSRGGSG